MEERSDADIVAAVLRGHTEGYRLLVDRYRDRCNRFAVRFLGDGDDADEALQSAFLRAFRGLAGCREPERFGSWLFQIVANECRSLAARRARRARRFVRHDESPFEPRSEHPAASDALLGEIEHALLHLEPEQREAFLLKHVEGLSYEEMAVITGAGVSALKMRVQRACTRLRVLLEGVRR